MPRPSKYQPLVDFLAARQGGRLRLSLPAIEQVLTFALPPSASVDVSWWTSQRHPRVQQWTALGWRAHLDVYARAVVFTRSSEE